jgi:hypothetical protein
MDNLRNQFPTAEIPSLSNFIMTYHGTDENRFGAFSVIDSCQRSMHRFYKAFIEPLRNEHGVAMVRFAGEAHCPAFSGYTHGAFLLSGILDTAVAYLHDADIDPKPEERIICEKLSVE